MKIRGAVLTAVALGMAAAISACSDAGDRDNRMYALSDVEGFLPESARFDYFYEGYEFQTAGEVWEAVWSDDHTFEPAECRAYEVAARFTSLETDESQTADDSIVWISGVLAGSSPGADGYITAKVRVSSSPASARAYVSSLQSSAALCTDGYEYRSTTLEVTVDSIDVSEIDLPGVGNVLVLDERDLNEGRIGDPDSMIPLFAHHTNYVYIQGNVVFIASYAFNGGSVTDDDAAELIGQFIAHLG